jgi:hypothetical protein
MGSDSDEGKTAIFGQGLPGTGGDLAPTDVDNDVEGHRAGTKATPEPDGASPRHLTPEPGDEVDDVEGHLFRTGPTTEGEFSRRGPGENPHGDR